MKQSLNITAVELEPALLDLPWDLPLEHWPDDLVAALPRGISRHIVRFVNLDKDRIIAVKEIGEHRAHHEYDALRNLERLGAPAVEPVAVITGRTTSDGEALGACLITAHLPYSLPYRALFGNHQRPETAKRLIDALSVLMVRLHLLGFFWGDVSLSNTLFRRDAGAFAAYLVDAETGEIYDTITHGKRDYDIDVARTNIIGELMDLQAGGVLPDDYDAIAIGDYFVKRYNELWAELTKQTSMRTNERWKVAERIERLNDLGFDVGELAMTSDLDGTHLYIQPKVVDAGHYSRLIMRLTGMDVEENQARRMMNDIEQYRANHNMMNEDLLAVAHDWMINVFEPTVGGVPHELRGKLEPGEIFHQFLEHRWYISEQAGHDIPSDEALRSFVDNVLRLRRDERSFLDHRE
ncbi:DUF4032 domain-containing protein [Arcanobacterium haemolyticum]|nr:DUF4032 domain-containing protein [Arcanobacterium haemolyticum]